jgi:hypothetical protein
MTWSNSDDLSRFFQCRFERGHQIAAGSDKAGPVDQYSGNVSMKCACTVVSRAWQKFDNTDPLITISNCSSAI